MSYDKNYKGFDIYLIYIGMDGWSIISESNTPLDYHISKRFYTEKEVESVIDRFLKHHTYSTQEKEYRGLYYKETILDGVAIYELLSKGDYIYTRVEPCKTKTEQELLNAIDKTYNDYEKVSETKNGLTYTYYKRKEV